MPQVRLQNKIGRTALVGQVVKLAPDSTTAFILANTPDPDAIGTVSQPIQSNYWGLIDLINTVDTSLFLSNEFESISKNLKSYPYVITYIGSDIDYITYITDTGTIIKTFNYTLSVLTSLVLSGDTPSGIELTKTLHYSGSDLTSVTYS
jgi:hypothetical protein